MKNVMKKAHEITKNIIKKGDSYRATFRLALIFVHSQIKRGVKVMVELKGTEKQIKWANDIRDAVLVACDSAIDAYEEMQQETFARKGKRLRRRDSQIQSIRDMKVELEKAEIASYFIDEYSYFLKKDVTERSNEIMRIVQA